MKYLLILSWFVLTSSAFGYTSDDLLHPVAHGAGSYLLTHAGEVVCKKVSGWSKTTCSIISGAVATGIGAAIEATQPPEDNHTKSYVENAAGVILAIGMIHLDF